MVDVRESHLHDDAPACEKTRSWIGEAGVVYHGPIEWRIEIGEGCVSDSEGPQRLGRFIWVSPRNCWLVRQWRRAGEVGREM